MAALSADRIVRLKNIEGGKKQSALVASGVTIYKGGLCCYDASGELIVPADSASQKFAGLALNGAVAGGRVELYQHVEALLPCESDITVADVETQVYCNDSGSVVSAATVSAACGVCKSIEASGWAWVALNEVALPANS